MCCAVHNINVLAILAVITLMLNDYHYTRRETLLYFPLKWLSRL